MPTFTSLNVIFSCPTKNAIGHGFRILKTTNWLCSNRNHKEKKNKKEKKYNDVYSFKRAMKRETYGQERSRWMNKKKKTSLQNSNNFRNEIDNKMRKKTEINENMNEDHQWDATTIIAIFSFIKWRNRGKKMTSSVMRVKKNKEIM